MIFKLAARDIKDKPAITIILLLSVIIAVCTLYCTFCYGDAMYNYAYDAAVAENGNADIKISSNSTMGSNFVSIDGLAAMDGVETVVGALELPATLNNVVVHLQGHASADIEKFNKIVYKYKEFESASSMPSDRVIICESFAKANGLRLYDEISLKVINNERTLYVGAIAEDAGCFLDRANVVIGTDKAVGGFIGWNSGYLYNSIFINCLETADLQSVYQEILNLPQNSYVSVEILNNEDIADSISRQFKALFSAAAIILIVLVILIIVKLMQMRLSSQSGEIVRLKAIGATTGHLVALYLMQFGIIALVGSIIGAVLGAIAFNIIISSTILPLYAFFDFGKLVLAMFSAILLTLVAALYPIIKVARRSLRDSMSENRKTTFKARPLLTLLFGVIFTVLAVLNYTYVGPGGLLGLFGIISGTVFLVLLSPVVLHFIGSLMVRFGKKELYLAGESVKQERAVLSAVQLFVLGVCVASVLSISLNMENSFSQTANTFGSNTVVVERLDNLTDEDYENIKNYDGGIARFYYKERIEIAKNGEAIIASVYATDSNGLDRLYDVTFEDASQAEVSQLIGEKSNSMVMSLQYRYCNGYNIGDEVSITYMGKTETFIVKAFVFSLKNHGSLVWVNREYFVEKFEVEPATRIYIETNGNENVVSDIAQMLAGKDAYVAKLLDETATNYQVDSNTNRFFSLLITYIVSMIAVAMACNMLYGSIFRREEYSKYMVIGLSRIGLLKRHMLEHLIPGIVFGLIALLGSIVFTKCGFNTMMLAGNYYGSFMDWPSLFKSVGIFIAVYLCVPFIIWLFDKTEVNLKVYKKS